VTTGYAGRAMTMPDQPPAEPSTRLERELKEAAEPGLARVERRRDRIRDELERNRAGHHRVPTWVLAAVLAAIIIGWVVLVLVTAA
jgi:hypothetical protein